MTQNRPPPAYQEYAASMLANNNFRMMSLAARGLLYTLRLEHWVGNPLTTDPDKLAKILRLDADLVTSALREHGDLIVFRNGMIIIPELDDYRQHLTDIRKKQSSGGKEGAAIAKKNAESRKQTNQPEAPLVVNQRSTHDYTTRSLAQNKSIQPNTTQSSSVINKRDEWIDDYDKSEVHGH